MYLEKLYLSNFKSHAEENFNFSENLNCILGNNGSGKTNLLDAIYFLALSKSAFYNQDAFCINHEAIFFMLDGVFIKDERQHQITCSLQRGQRKILMHDKKQYERIADHIGQFPAVLIAPDDTALIKEGSEERRRFFDAVLSQMDSEYLADYQQYNRLLDQRNGLLKNFHEQNYIDQDLLDIFSEPLVELALKIFEQRKIFLQIFIPLFKKQYQNLSEGQEDVEIIYESEVANEDFKKEFRRNRLRDMQSQRTNVGIHKDDYVFEISNYPVKKFGSQGQQKSFMMALKLAQYELLERNKGFKPILLLDDIFDKLDEVRIEKLLKSIENKTFGQVFITDARPERTKDLLQNLKTEIRYFTI